ICPALPVTEFADVTAKAYQLETRLYYDCDTGYRRRSGQSSVIRCRNLKQGASWDYKGFECIGKLLFSFFYTCRDVSITKKKKKKVKLICFNWVLPFDPTDLCGPPRTIPHASLRPQRKYYVGQVVHFKCQSGYDKRPPTSGTRTCKKENAKIIWTHLDMRCTNGS
ncbi:IL2RA protein, partial [Semnornis frantzii]|nr:IL2RA protein [Semnornis frantzii]